MKTKRIICALTTVAILTGTLSVSASSIAIIGDYTEPMAYLLEELKADENGYYYTDNRNNTYYLNEESINWFEITEIRYDIYLDKDSSFSEAETAAIGEAFRKPYAIEPVVISTEENAEASSITLLKNEDGSYSLTWKPSNYLFYEDTLITILNQMPSLCSVKKNVVGFNKTEIYANYITLYNTQLLVEITDGAELTTADLPEDISITELKKVTENVAESWKTFYCICLDTEKYGKKIAPDTIYPIVKELAALEMVKKVELYDWEIAESAVIPNDDIMIDNGVYTLFTRGDCDRDDSVTIYDAYRALISSSLEALGESSHLTDREYTAADVNGDGKVSMNDAYNILMYSSGQYLGTDTGWSDILQ